MSRQRGPLVPGVRHHPPKPAASQRRHDRARLIALERQFVPLLVAGLLPILLLPLTVAHGQTKAQAQDAALQILSRFGLEGHANQKPASLSGGQKQRIAIARALVTKPQLILLDEPTSALDPEMTHEVLEMIKELRDQGRELILATHEMAFAKNAADQIAFVAEGRILESGKPSELFASPKSPHLRMFLSKEIQA